MSRGIQRTQRRLEQLEARQVLAANIMAQVVEGNLFIVGGGGNIGFTIGQPTPGEFEIAGQNGTTVNGQTTPFDVTGVTADIGISLGKGNDNVELFGVSAPRGLSITLGNGDDILNLTNVSVANSATIKLGNGNDTVTLGAAVVSPDASVINQLPGVDVGNSLSIRLGNGQDGVSIGHAQIGDNALVMVGNGNDTIQLGTSPLANLVAGQVPFAVTVGNNLAVVAGNGTSVTGIASVIPSGGGNTINLDSVHAGNAWIMTGRGNDNVTLANSDFDIFFAALGAGDDTLDLSAGGNDIGTLVAGGGAGNDTYLDSDSNQIGKQTLFSFENHP